MPQTFGENSVESKNSVEQTILDKVQTKEILIIEKNEPKKRQQRQIRHHRGTRGTRIQKNGSQEIPLPVNNYKISKGTRSQEKLQEFLPKENYGVQNANKTGDGLNSVRLVD